MNSLANLAFLMYLCTTGLKEYKHLNSVDRKSQKKEIIRLKRENEILKKAIAVLANEYMTV